MPENPHFSKHSPSKMCRYHMEVNHFDACGHSDESPTSYWTACHTVSDEPDLEVDEPCDESDQDVHYTKRVYEKEGLCWTCSAVAAARAAGLLSPESMSPESMSGVGEDAHSAIESGEVNDPKTSPIGSKKSGSRAGSPPTGPKGSKRRGRRPRSQGGRERYYRVRKISPRPKKMIHRNKVWKKPTGPKEWNPNVGEVRPCIDEARRREADVYNARLAAAKEAEAESLPY